MPAEAAVQVLPKSVGLEDVGVEVVGAVAVEGDVAGPLVEVRGLDPAAPDPGGTPLMFGRTLVQVTPPLRVSWTLPSSVPTQSRPGSFGDSEMVMMVQ